MEISNVINLFKLFHTPDNDIRLKAEQEYFYLLEHDIHSMILIIFGIIDTNSNNTIGYQALIEAFKIMRLSINDEGYIGEETIKFMRNKIISYFSIINNNDMNHFLVSSVCYYIKLLKSAGKDEWIEILHFFLEYIKVKPSLALEFFSSYILTYNNLDIVNYILGWINLDSDDQIYLQKSLIYELFTVISLQQPNELLQQVPNAFSKLSPNLLCEPLNILLFGISNCHVIYFGVIDQIIEFLLTTIMDVQVDEMIRRQCLFIFGKVISVSSSNINFVKENPKPFFDLIVSILASPDYEELYDEAKKQFHTIFSDLQHDTYVFEPFIREYAMDPNPFVSSFFIGYIKDNNALPILIQYSNSPYEQIRDNGIYAINRIIKKMVNIDCSELLVFLKTGLCSFEYHKYLELVMSYICHQYNNDFSILYNNFIDRLSYLLFKKNEMKAFNILSLICMKNPNECKELIYRLLRFIKEILEQTDEFEVVESIGDLIVLIDRDNAKKYLLDIWEYVLKDPQRYCRIESCISNLCDDFEVFLESFMKKSLSFLNEIITNSMCAEITENFDYLDETKNYISKTNSSKWLCFNLTELNIVVEILWTYNVCSEKIKNLFEPYIFQVLEITSKFTRFDINDVSTFAINLLSSITEHYPKEEIICEAFKLICSTIEESEFFISIKFLINLLIAIFNHVPSSLIQELPFVIAILLNKTIKFFKQREEEDLYFDSIDYQYLKEMFIDLAFLHSEILCKYYEIGIQLFESLNKIIFYFKNETRHVFLTFFSMLIWTDVLIFSKSPQYDPQIFLNDLIYMLKDERRIIQKKAILCISAFCCAKTVDNIEDIFNIFIDMIKNTDDYKIKLFLGLKIGKLLKYYNSIPNFDDYIDYFIGIRNLFVGSCFNDKYFILIAKIALSLQKSNLNPCKVTLCNELIQNGIINNVLNDDAIQRIESIIDKDLSS